jgi:hypothetical protein
MVARIEGSNSFTCRKTVGIIGASSKVSSAFGATIFFGTEDQAGANRMVDYARLHFFDAVHLWFSPPEMKHQSRTVSSKSPTPS